jgi:hypothetical protein
MIEEIPIEEVQVITITKEALRTDQITEEDSDLDIKIRKIIVFLAIP